MSTIVEAMTYLLKILYSFSTAVGLPYYGVAIILLTMLIKTLIFPLTYKQMASMRKTVDLQPKIKAIQEKYKNNKEKANAAVMELYKEHNVNPLGGCLPIVVQLPIFWALYSALLHFPYDPANASAHLFLGFDLTKIYGFAFSYHLILPIFAAATTFLQTKLTSPNASTDPTQKTMLYIMPVFFAYISVTVPAGLALYWVTMNVVSIFQQLFINSRLSNKGKKAI
ncbi:YidC/Oxa1 family membrane protein insertase [Desulfosporosinus meridiei]|uniref:Preprotein translocase subunit YidC n=1 Tax=Desulfosporosinus meridiei (strain ATCC BAA-275 / DSM 13257 / KCTC 12902 / NCIMB 13706 / S10) TaxID=768704 RepID=J7IXI0_DESMD|nr:YidC/Oxa1 family membrane protein insertase [Desulfosporosinus meridiei]AFQ46460.1 preprotein translocase subunit YidC [Desulfosporosinus meridiei DSM 13257]